MKQLTEIHKSIMEYAEANSQEPADVCAMLLESFMNNEELQMAEDLENILFGD